MRDEIVVSPGWLVEHMNGPDVVIIDVRPPPLYLMGHIGGARNLPAAFLLTASSQPLPAQTLNALLQRAGVKPGDLVIAVDDAGVQPASILVWILHHYGHERAALLEGGMQGWPRPDLLTRDREQVSASGYELPEPEGRLAVSTDRVLKLIEAAGSGIVDVRSEDEYAGADGHGVTGGHIPSAVHMEWTENLSVGDESVTWREGAELRDRYLGAVDGAEDGLVLYCHAGPRATAAYVGARRAGFDDVKLYLPGWSEWGARPDTPKEITSPGSG